jgi:hypothetical protein
MSSVSKSWRAAAVAVSASMMMVVLGCSGDESGLGRRYKITGKVTYNGQAVPSGTVNFIPLNPKPPEGRAATGTIKDGLYSLTTAGDNDGALPGEYGVAIVSLDMDLAGAASSKEEGGMIHQGDARHQKAIKNAKKLIPDRYGLIEKSGLKATVDKSKTIDFTLTD